MDGDFRLSGFASWSVTQSNNARPYYYGRNIDDNLCYDCDTIAGLQLDYKPLEVLRASLQAVKRAEDNFSDPAIEWAYIGYSPVSQLEVRAGRIRGPLFLTSSYFYVANSYPWMRPNTEVYSRQFGITAFDGFDLMLEFVISDSGVISIHPYFGGGSDVTVDLIRSIYEVEFDNIMGIAVDIEEEHYRLHMAYQQSKSDLDITSELSPGIWSAAYSVQGYKHKVFTLGLIYEMAALEWWLETVKVSDNRRLDAYSYYVGLAWNLEDGWVPYAQLAQSKDDDMTNSDSALLGVRYNILPNLSTNLEFNYSKIKGELDVSENVFPKGQFAISPFRLDYGNQLQNEPPLLVDDGEDDDVLIISLGLNWNF